MLVCRQLHTEQESCKSRVPFGERNQKIFQLKELKNQMSHFNAKKNNAYRRSHKMPDDKCCCKIFFFFFILKEKEMVASQRKGQNNACISLLTQICVLICLLLSRAQLLVVVRFLNRVLILSALPVYYQDKK